MERNPDVFIGSSSEQLRTAREVRELLRPDLDADVWDEGVFGLGNSYLEDLLKAVDTYDFAVFVFAPDDLTTMRAKRAASVRDNVVFELGLFMGQLGRHRAFWLVPRGKRQPKIPTDSKVSAAPTSTVLRLNGRDPGHSLPQAQRRSAETGPASGCEL